MGRSEFLQQIDAVDFLLESVPGAFYIKNHESKVIACNNRYAKLFGMSKDEIVGLCDNDLFTAEHANQARKDELWVMQNRKPIIDVIEKETWLDGKITWANTTKKPVFSKEGEVIGIVGISKDISEEVALQNRIEEQGNNLKSLQSDMKRMNANLLKSNRALKDRNEELSKALATISIANKRIIQSNITVAKSRLMSKLAHEINTPFAIIKSLTQTNLSDLSNLKETIVAINELNSSEIKELNGLIDFNTSKHNSHKKFRSSGKLDNRSSDRPLNIDDYISSLEMGKHSKVLEIASKLNQIWDNITLINNTIIKSSKIIYSLREFSNVQGSSRFQKLNLVDTLKHAIEFFNDKWVNDYILEENLPEEIQIYGNPDDLVQAWICLIQNSIDAMETNPGKIIVAISFLDVENVTIKFSDSGNGINKLARDKIFNTFFTTKEYQADRLGLGLSIVKDIIQIQHCGKVTFYTSNSGTTFEVCLPLNITEKVLV